MIDGLIGEGQIVRHTRSQGKYTIVCLGKMKMGAVDMELPLQRWEPCVTYVDDGGNYFTRDTQHFRINFEEWKP